jgi:hypothetical protein
MYIFSSSLQCLFTWFATIVHSSNAKVGCCFVTEKSPDSSSCRFAAKDPSSEDSSSKGN